MIENLISRTNEDIRFFNFQAAMVTVPLLLIVNAAPEIGAEGGIYKQVFAGGAALLFLLSLVCIGSYLFNAYSLVRSLRHLQAFEVDEAKLEKEALVRWNKTDNLLPPFVIFSGWLFGGAGYSLLLGYVIFSISM